MAKGTGLSNMAKNLTFTPRLDGKPKLYAGGGVTAFLSVIGLSNGSKVRLPLAVDFENRSDEELTIGVSAVFVNYKGEKIAQSVPGVSSVRIAKQGKSTLSGINVDVSLSSLISIAGQAISTKLSGGDFSALTNDISVDLSIVINNAIVVNVSKKLGEEGTVQTDKQTDKTLLGLGLVATKAREIRSIGDYIAYLPSKTELRYNDLVVVPNGGVRDTAELMHKVVRAYASDTAEIAKRLASNTLRDTLANIWKFVYTHIQYVRDSPLREQVRRPLRTLYDQKGDCDCYATLIGSILTNLNIPFKFRIAAYEAGRYQHVYVVVPVDDGGYYAVDPVMDVCFAEKQPSKFFDV